MQKNSGGAVLTTIDYEYDVFDRRIARISTPAVGAAISQHFVYDGDHIALQFDGGTLTHRYLYGPVVDQILADEQVGTGDILWPLTDNLGSVRDIASYNAGTDTTTIANHIVYDAFGRVISETNSAVDLLFGYTGRDWDAQAELQYNRARWYDPKIGQWLSEDPIGFEAGDANVRRYVGNGVTTKVDPSGLQDVLNVPSVAFPDTAIHLIEMPDFGRPNAPRLPIILHPILPRTNPLKGTPESSGEILVIPTDILKDLQRDFPLTCSPDIPKLPPSAVSDLIPKTEEELNLGKTGAKVAREVFNQELQQAKEDLQTLVDDITKDVRERLGLKNTHRRDPWTPLQPPARDRSGPIIERRRVRPSGGLGDPRLGIELQIAH